MKGTIGRKGLAIFVICVSLFTTACASRVDQVVKDASKRLWQQTTEIPLGPATDAALEDLANRIRSFGLTVLFDEIPDDLRQKYGAGLRGMSNSRTGVILVDMNLATGQKLNVLAHEIAHFFHPPQGTQGQNEVFSELVAMEVAAYYKLDTRKSSANYLSRYKADLPSAKINKEQMKLAVEVITGQRAFEPNMIVTNWQ